MNIEHHYFAIFVADEHNVGCQQKWSEAACKTTAGDYPLQADWVELTILYYGSVTLVKMFQIVRVESRPADTNLRDCSHMISEATPDRQDVAYATDSLFL